MSTASDTETIAEAVAALEIPALLIAGEQVLVANPAARSLLGAHIEGEDVRIAIRHPEALPAMLDTGVGTVRISGLSAPGSVWELSSRPLKSGLRLVTLQDRSVQVSVARAHADFVANASHELRTPLAAILGYVETLADPAAGANAKTRDQFLATIRREGQRMQALVEDLMSLSRIEAGKHEAPSEPVDLVSLIRELASEAQTFGPVELEVEGDEALAGGDRGQLAQAIRNLIDNARKYGRPGSTIRIRLEAAGTGWAAINVRDEGEGIAPEHLPRLTERFYRVDAGRSRKAGGTGLGLSIVKHIIERHRGRFDMSSRLGSGTVASVMLPLLGR